VSYTNAEFTNALAAIAEGSVDPGRLITSRIGIDDVPAAFARLADTNDEGKVVCIL